MRRVFKRFGVQVLLLFTLHSILYVRRLKAYLASSRRLVAPAAENTAELEHIERESYSEEAPIEVAGIAASPPADASFLNGDDGSAWQMQLFDIARRGFQTYYGVAGGYVPVAVE